METSGYISYAVKFTEMEYRLLAKGLALLSGVALPPIRPEEQAEAAELNTMLLKQRKSMLESQLKSVNDALMHAGKADG